MSEIDNIQYEALWSDMSPVMRKALQDPKDIHQSTFAALWKRGLLEPGDFFSYEVSTLGKAVLRWAKRLGHIS